MYYVNEEQIKRRLDFIPFMTEMSEQIRKSWSENARWDDDGMMLSLAQERLLHLAIETVTDVGSLLIDGFMMREASSYEDIVRVLADEKVFSEDAAAVLFELVKLRRPLVQQYIDWERGKAHELLDSLPGVLQDFRSGVIRFMHEEWPEFFAEGDER